MPASALRRKNRDISFSNVFLLRGIARRRWTANCGLSVILAVEGFSVNGTASKSKLGLSVKSSPIHVMVRSKKCIENSSSSIVNLNLE